MITQVSARHDGDTAMADDVVSADAASVRRARDETLPADVAGSLAAIFAALGEPTRLRIVHALSVGELCVGDLAAVLGMAVPAVSQHLRVLRDLRIVRNRRAGKMIYYALDDAHVADLFALALAHVRGGTS
jgi:DNA-binding transcriptional ArsR family regulator